MKSPPAKTGFKRIPSAGNLPRDLRGGVVAIGNFDGVHRGHRAVLDCALAIAKRLDRPAMVLTFDPHPRAVFHPDISLHILTPPPMKALIFETIGFSAVIEQPFTPAFARLSADEFVSTVLENSLGIAHAVIGFNFHFGKGREGRLERIQWRDGTANFGVTTVDSFLDRSAEVISSTKIRELIAEGSVAEASKLLGYCYTIEATVVGSGFLEEYGRFMLKLKAAVDLGLKVGFYAVRFCRFGHNVYDGVARYGPNPTLDDGMPALEILLPDFANDLGDEVHRISFCGFMQGRDASGRLESWSAWLGRNCEKVSAIAVGLEPLSPLNDALLRNAFVGFSD